MSYKTEVAGRMVLEGMVVWHRWRCRWEVRATRRLPLRMRWYRWQTGLRTRCLRLLSPQGYLGERFRKWQLRQYSKHYAAQHAADPIFGGLDPSEPDWALKGH